MKRKYILEALGFGLACSLSTLQGFAQQPPPPAPGPMMMPLSTPVSRGLGDQGQIAISSDFSLGFSRDQQRPPQGDAPSPTTTITLAPALDYFVIDNLSVGGSIVFSYTKQPGATGLNGASSSTSQTTFGIGPRIGYDIPITDTFSFWPKLGLSYGVTSLSGSDNNGNSYSASGHRFTLDIFAPFVLEPATHFFVGLGPSFSTDLSSKVEGMDADKTLSYGIRSVVGGWF